MILASAFPLVAQQDPTLSPPVAAREAHETSIHGYKLSDDYFWLRQKTNPAVRAYLDAENAYTAAMMKHTEALQQSLYDEITGHVKQTDLSVPYRRGAYLYYSKTETGKQYPIYVRKPVKGGPEQVLLDQNEMAKGQGYYSIGARVVSDDDSLLAFTFDSTGYRQYTLRIKNLRTGQMLPDRVPRVGSVVWSTDGRTLFLTTEDSITKRSDKFWRHPVGGATMNLLFDEKDELFDIGANRSLDRKMIFLQSAAKTSSEIQYLPADKPSAALTVMLPRENGHEYDADYDGGRFYIRTNKGAKNFRVVSAPVAAPAKWTEVVAGKPDVKIAGMEFYRDHIVLSEREGGLPYLRIIDKKTGASYRIATPEPAYSMAIGANAEYDTRVIQYVYNSLVTPSSTFEYDMSRKTRKLLKQQEVPGYSASGYESRRIWATARDGTKVPMALVYKKGTKMDGSAPMLLYAYGSYGSSQDAGFSSNRLSLLDRGFIWALANIRGGGELGEEWREAGRMMNKMNTFTDFIDVGEYLVKNKYTSSDRLMIQGGSAGGLLMGAVVNMKPDLFKAAIAAVPFVDVMNTMLDASLPLTTSEYTEWGNPNEKPAFDYMMKYSPYDNVKAQWYPNMLVEVSLNDSQVPYWEGAKFVAKLRAMKQGDNVLLLKANMGAGHGGASGRYDRYREIAFEYAFLLSQAPFVSSKTPGPML
ncbi:MAG: S9 family peptidase [Gemmatimonadaceae bacterium]|nr:S9 family peptidase [Gemmatimonadaceae bacterium]